MDRKKETLLGCVYFDWQSATTWACNGKWIGAQIGLFKVVLQTLSSSPLSAPFYSLQHSNCLPLQVPFTHSYFYRLRSAFLPSHTHTNTLTLWWMLQGQLEVRYLAQGYSSTRTGGVNDQSTDLPISSQPALPPEPQPAVRHLTSDVWLKDKKMAVASLVRISLTNMSLLRFFYAF